MPQSLLEVLHRRSGRRSQALTRVSQIVKRNLNADAIPRPDERLVDRVASHPLAVPTHTEELRTGEFNGVLAQQRQDVRWHIDGPEFFCVGRDGKRMRGNTIYQAFV